MRLNTYLSLIFCFTAFSGYSQITFNKIYGTDYREDSFEVITNSQGEYVIVGNTFGFGADSEMFLFRVDEYGNQIGFTKYFGVSVDHARHVAERSSGGYFISGMTASYGLGTSSGFVIATDSNGDFNWAKTYGGAEGTNVRQMLTDDNGNLYLILQGADNISMHFVKLDNNGNTLQTGGFTSAFGDNLYFDNFTIVASLTTDQGILMAAKRGSSGGMLVLKVDSSFNFEWATNLPSIGQNAWPTALISNNENGAIIYGNMTGGFGNSKDIFVVNIDSLGNAGWGMTYGGLFEEVSSDIISTSDGGLCMTGHTVSTGNGSHDYFLLKTDSIGFPEWAYAYGRPWSDKPYGLTHGTDEGYMISGITYTESTNIDSTEIYLIKTAANGTADCQHISWNILYEPITEIDQEFVVYLQTEASEMQNEMVPHLATTINERTYCGFDFVTVEENELHISTYPNPASEELRIELSSSIWSSIDLIDSRGLRVRTLETTNAPLVRVQRDNLPSGVYLLRVNFHDKEPLITRVVFL